MIGAALILAGYVTLVLGFGWLGVAACAVHIAVMLACMPKR